MRDSDSVVSLYGTEDLLHTAWIIICNVSEGDWEKQTEEWQEAAGRLRVQYHTHLKTLNEPLVKN